MQNLCFKPECAISRYRSYENGSQQKTHSTPLDPKWCLGVLRSISQTFGMWKDAKLVFQARMHYFGVPKLRRWFRNEYTNSTPLNPKWCLGVLRSISQTFGMWKDGELVFQAWMHYFGVSKLRKWFRNEYSHSTPLDRKWWLGVLRSISQTFGMWKDAKLVFQARMHYFGVPKLWRWFRNEYTHSNPLDPKWCLGVLRSISQTFGMWKDAKLVFQAWMHYFGVPKLRKWFRNEYTHSTPLDRKWWLGVLRSISQTFGMWKDAKLVFQAWMRYFKVP